MTSWLGHVTTSTTMGYWNNLQGLVAPAVRQKMKEELLELGFIAP